MIRFFCKVWLRLQGRENSSLQFRMSELSPEQRAFFFALTGTSKEDRAWMNHK